VILWYSEYCTFNAEGTRPTALLVSAIIIGTMKKTVSRLLVLVVCMGYGIVTPNLGDKACQIMVFGCVYCIFSAVLDVVKALSHDSDVSGGFFILVIIPVAVLDSIFYLWTFMSLYDVVAQLEASIHINLALNLHPNRALNPNGLKERRQTVKLQLYRKFIWVLGTCLFLSCVWVIYQMYFLYANLFPSHWQLAWMFDAYWYTLSLAILLAIMYLWAPNENSKRYAYYEENVNLGEVDDGMELDESMDHNSLAPAFSIDDDEVNEDEKDLEGGNEPPAYNDSDDAADVKPESMSEL